MTHPGEQKPHCVPFPLASRSWIGCGPSEELPTLPEPPMPSTVTTAMPSQAQSGRRQALTGKNSDVPVAGGGGFGCMGECEDGRLIRFDPVD